MMYAHFELFFGTDNQYYFRFISASQINLGYSEGYTAKHNAVNGITAVKNYAKNISNFTIFKGSDGFYYFNLKVTNGEVILRSSRKYSFVRDANLAANEVSLYAPNAFINDLTQTTAKNY